MKIVFKLKIECKLKSFQVKVYSKYFNFRFEFDLKIHVNFCVADFKTLVN